MKVGYIEDCVGPCYYDYDENGGGLNGCDKFSEYGERQMCGAVENPTNEDNRRAKKIGRGIAKDVVPEKPNDTVMEKNLKEAQRKAVEETLGEGWRRIWQNPDNKTEKGPKRVRDIWDTLEPKYPGPE